MLLRYQLWMAWILAIGLSVSGSAYFTSPTQISMSKPFIKNNQQPGTAQAAVATADPIPLLPPATNAPPGKLADGVPILMYHSISEANNKLCVSPTDFTAQLNYLVHAGYQTITVRQLMMAIDGHGALPPKPVVITMDDGYRDNYTIAYPLLKERNMVATIYMIAQKVGTANGITTSEIKEMYDNGIEIGSHTQHHLDLRYLNDAQLNEEIAGSRQLLSTMLQLPVETFCYPSGRYSPLAIQKVETSYYLGAVTTQPGIVNNENQRWLMPRIRVDGGESLEIFIANLPKNI